MRALEPEQPDSFFRATSEWLNMLLARHRNVCRTLLSRRYVQSSSSVTAIEKILLDTIKVCLNFSPSSVIRLLTRRTG